MIPARRHQLQQTSPVKGSTNPGLWLDRFLVEQQKRGESVKNPPRPLHFKQVVDLGASSVYRHHFRARREALEMMAFGDFLVRPLRVQATARLTTGLGAANVLENGFSLHRTYGVPFLPATGLKGLAARTARERSHDARWQVRKNERGESQCGEYYAMLFGSNDEAGAVEWFDALPDPTRPFELIADVMTPHHGDYNGGENKPPADWDSPKPVPFLSCTGCFEMVLLGPSQWVTLAQQIILKGLAEDGFGAKTSSGFGRMQAV